MGATPRDLDSHLIGPTSSGSTFHIWFSSKSYSEDNKMIADLDLDDTNSYGPETTTIYNPIEGEYVFYVYNWSGNPDIKASGATVKVFNGNSNEPAYVFSVPLLGTGRYWTVFKYDSKTRRIAPINSVSNSVQVDQVKNRLTKQWIALCWEGVLSEKESIYSNNGGCAFQCFRM